MRIRFLVLFFLLAGRSFASDVSLAWDPSTSPNITGYKIYVGQASRSYSNVFVVGNQTTFTVTGLGPGTYFFTATAFDASGSESDYSNEVSQIIPGTAPPLTLTGPKPVSGTVGTALTATFTAGGGTPPYSFVILGNLPPGLLVTAPGVLSGTPTTAGQYVFSVRVTDSMAAATNFDTFANIASNELKITSMSASLRWFGVVVQATTSIKATAILRYSKIEPGAGTTAVIVTTGSGKTSHQAVLYLPAGSAYYRYEWEVTAASGTGTSIKQGGTFQTR